MMNRWDQKMVIGLAGLAGCVIATLSFAQPLDAARELVDALNRPGRVLFMRHALAPGSGDPKGFTIGDCSTQRNLSEAGRDQARFIGRQLKAAGVTIDVIYTSQWCRCKETAQLLALAPVEELRALNSTWLRDADTKNDQTQTLRRFLRSLSDDKNYLFVTHFANINDLTGEGVSSGEMVVVSFDDQQASVVERMFTSFMSDR